MTTTVLQVGGTVGDLVLEHPDGTPWRLSDHAGVPVVLVYHRHLACLPCQEHLREIRDRLDEFGDAAVAVVSFTPRERLEDYRRFLDLPFPVLADPTRATYEQFGFVRGRVRDVWSLATIRQYGQLLREGRRLLRPTEDTLQLGGDVVIGRDRRVRYLARPTGPAERPPVDELIAALD
jgi:peroxiredoxin